MSLKNYTMKAKMSQSTLELSKVSLSYKVTGPSLVTWKLLSLAMNMIDWEMDMIDYNGLESLVMWSDATVSIIHVLMLDIFHKLSSSYDNLSCNLFLRFLGEV